MKLPPTSQQKSTVASVRTAFTLVELLVVIAIIIVLVSLLMVGVFKALDTAYEAQTRTDITQIAAALESVKMKYGRSYVPSRIILCKDYLNYFNNRDPQQGAITPLHKDSLDYLQGFFPRITTPPAGQPLPQWALPPLPAWAGVPQPSNVYTGIDWNSTGASDQVMNISVYPVGNISCLGYVLEGEQCLVFFIGGIPGNGTMNGFAKNASNPAAPTGDRDPSFFDFKTNRLQVILGTADGFPSYIDGYGTAPYAYFSSYKQPNGYNRYVNYSNPYLPLVPGSPITSDCQALQNFSRTGTAVFPYAQPANPGALPVYLNSQTYQLISAGKNKNFGIGSVVQTYPGFPAGNPSWSWAAWSPAGATAFYPLGSDGYDDIANFYDRLLGVPTQ